MEDEDGRKTGAGAVEPTGSEVAASVTDPLLGADQVDSAGAVVGDGVGKGGSLGDCHGLGVLTSGVVPVGVEVRLPVGKGVEELEVELVLGEGDGLVGCSVVEVVVDAVEVSGVVPVLTPWHAGK